MATYAFTLVHLTHLVLSARPYSTEYSLSNTRQTAQRLAGTDVLSRPLHGATNGSSRHHLLAAVSPGATFLMKEQAMEF